jgi:hypothetical protein
VSFNSSNFILYYLILFTYAATVTDPAAVPIAEELVIVELVDVPASLIVPLFKFIAFAPTVRISFAFVALLLCAITNVNTNSLVPVPLAYGKLCGPRPDPVPWFPLVSARYGVPPDVSTSTASLNLARTDNVLLPAADVDTSGGTPYLALTNGNQGTGSGRGPHNLPYVSGTGTNELVFTLVIAQSNNATNANDILTVGANAMNLNSGTIKDAGTSTNSTITSSSAIGTAAGSVTVAA